MKSGFATLSKILAVCLFLGLLSGYVWWRYDQAKKQEEQRMAMREAAAVKAVKEDAQTMSDWFEAEGVMMSSSKSGIVVMPSSKSGPAISLEELRKTHPELFETDGSEEEERVLLPGSKAAPVMPSSKSIDRILIPREQSNQK